MDNKVFAESRLYIFIGILICSIFTIPLYWYTKIFGLPVFEDIQKLSLKEIILFGSTSIISGFVFVILCLSIFFMIIRLFVPAKITIDNYCIKYGFKANFIPWSEIVNIKYLPDIFMGKQIVFLLLTLFPAVNWVLTLRLIQLRLILDSQPSDIILIQKSNRQNIILPIDPKFIPIEEEVEIIDILNACKDATIRREYLSGKRKIYKEIF